MADKPEEPKIAIVTDTGAASARFLNAIAPKPVPRPPLDPVAFPPTMTGPRGRAWSVNLVAARMKYGLDAAADATIHVWVIEAPWAHPIWHSYSLALVHLRPLPGGPKIHFYLPGATHEFWLHVLDPGEPGRQTWRQRLIAGGLFGHDGAPGNLTPMNFGAQLIAPSDAEAIAKVKASVQAIIDGVLSPDTDAGSDWQSIWGAAMIRPPFRV